MVWKGGGRERLAPCLVTLIDEIDARAPDRARQSDGSIGDRAHAARKSDHNPNAAGIVCALDITDDPPRFDPDDFAEVLRLRRDRRVKYLISDGRICPSYSGANGPAWEWRKYSGTNGHFAHLHISVLAERANDTTTWFPEGEDDMPLNTDDYNGIRETVRQVLDQELAGIEGALLGDQSPLKKILDGVRLSLSTDSRIVGKLDNLATMAMDLERALANAGATVSGDQVKAALREVFADAGRE